ncbi:MAG TPA: hypothetical protein VHZ51_12970, partial [Ktedonobacteraceae bacterium]|nr:hypothetical protein [Ktedonobacteraceae bacterium]
RRKLLKKMLRHCKAHRLTTAADPSVFPFSLPGSSQKRRPWPKHVIKQHARAQHQNRQVLTRLRDCAIPFPTWQARPLLSEEASCTVGAPFSMKKNSMD